MSQLQRLQGDKIVAVKIQIQVISESAEIPIKSREANELFL